MFQNTEAYKPSRMSNAEAADILQTFKFTSFVSGKTREALDRAIAVLQPEIVPTLKNIIDEVIQETGVSLDMLKAKCRCREYSEARYIFFWLAHKFTNASYTEIGRCVNREHVMVYYGIHKIDEWMSNPKINPDGKKIVDGIIERIVHNE